MLEVAFLIVGGAALATMGIVRLVRSGLRAMPRSVAAMVTAVGLAVLAFGALLPRLSGPANTEGTPITLEPDRHPASAGPLLRTDVHGVVRTVDGDPVGGATVVLSMAPGTAPRTTETSGDGSFRFSDVEVTGPVTVAAHYDGAVFEPAEATALSRSIEIRVAPTTTSTRSLSVSVSSLALVGNREGAQAVQALTIRNRGQRAFAGPLRLPLLPGAQTIEPGLGIVRSRLDVRDGSLESTTPLLPGDTQITYSYLAPVSRKGVSLRYRPQLHTERFDVLSSGPLVASDASPRAGSGRVRIGGREYTRVSWRDIGRDERLSVRIALRGGGNAVRIAAIIAAAIAAALIVLLPVLRRSRRAGPP